MSLLYYACFDNFLFFLAEDETMLCNSSVDWGFARFMLLSELTNSRNGFLLNDILTVEVEISLMGMLKNFI